MAQQMTYDDWDTLRERRNTARALRQRALTDMPQGQMVSGHYVTPSVTQYLAQALRASNAASEERNIDKQMRERRQATMDTYRKAMGLPPMESGGMQGQGTQPQSQGMQKPGMQPPAPSPMEPFDAQGGPQTYSLQEPQPFAGQPATGSMQSATGPMRAPGPMGPRSPQDMARVLMGNPDTMDQGMQMYLQDMQRRASLEQQMAMRQPRLQTYREGNEQVTVMLNPDGTMQEVARGAAFAPPNPGATINFGGTPVPAIGPDGQPGLFVLDRSTGQMVPTGARPVPEPEGRAKVTEFAGKAGMYATRMEEAERRLAEVPGGEPTFLTKLAQSFGPTGERVALTPDQQVYKQAVDDWIRAKLRFESGAVIGADEMAEEYLTYFPQPGDTPQNIAAKARARAIATQQMRELSGMPMSEPNAPEDVVDIEALP